jgi:hypothetical protein
VLKSHVQRKKYLNKFLVSYTGSSSSVHQQHRGAIPPEPGDGGRRGDHHRVPVPAARCARAHLQPYLGSVSVILPCLDDCR